MPWELRGLLDIGRALEDSIAGEQAATLISNEAAERMNSPRIGMLPYRLNRHYQSHFRKTIYASFRYTPFTPGSENPWAR